VREGEGVAAVPVAGSDALVAARASALRAQVVTLKRELRHTRDRLQDAASELVAVEAECRRRGIGFQVVEKGVR